MPFSLQQQLSACGCLSAEQGGFAAAVCTVPSTSSPVPWLSPWLSLFVCKAAERLWRLPSAVQTHSTPALCVSLAESYSVGQSALGQLLAKIWFSWCASPEELLPVLISQAMGDL